MNEIHKLDKKRSLIITLLTIFILTSSACLENSPKPSSDNNNSISDEIAFIPPEFQIYQNYIEIIRGRQGKYDTAVIEATVVSLNRTEKCPYDEEICSIQPYPLDTGVVRIDRIIIYIPFDEQKSEQSDEQTSEGRSSGDSNTTSQNIGKGLPEHVQKEYASLKEGQEVNTIFLLTSREVKIKYASIKSSQDGRESAQATDTSVVQQDILEGSVKYRPIPKEGDYFVFTTRIGDFKEPIEKIQPGLEPGSRFKAEIQYDGILYIKEFEKI